MSIDPPDSPLGSPPGPPRSTPGPPSGPADVDDSQSWEWLPRRPSPAVRLAVLLTGLLVVLLVAGIIGKTWLDNRLDPPGPQGDAHVVVIPSGASTNDIARILEEEGVVANSTIFRYYLRYKDAGGFLAGEYTFNLNMAVWEAKDVLLAGPVPLSGSTIDVLLPEGLRLRQITSELLLQVPSFDAAELDAVLTNPPVRSRFQPPGSSMEGMLFPDTYALDEATAGDEAALVSRMVARFDVIAEDTGLDRSVELVGLTPYEVAIVASLIEKEALIDEDRAKIARVIYNRLEAGWMLQIDAAVRYAVDKPSEPLTLSDLQTDHPYNLYTRTGLPPTPISAPGRDSLAAALNPVDGDWMFYARTDDPVPGAHTFSVTAEEHNQAVQICIERNLGCG